MELAEFLDAFNAKLLLDPAHIEKLDREYFLIGGHLRSLRKAIGRKAVYAGVFLGEARGALFAPSLQLLDMLNELKHVKKAVIGPKAEWLFITGKNILGSSVVRTVNNAYPGDTVLVLNERGEALGCGLIAPDRAGKERYIIQHKYDIGDFLRRERRLPKPGSRG
jgi:ribosome biogenesis protein Nip4